jgi:hypothetical protein
MSEKIPGQQGIENESKEFAVLARILEARSIELFPDGDRLMDKFIQLLEGGDDDRVKVFIQAEFDKFRAYGEDAIYQIIDIVYKGSGSPWGSLERKRAF